MSNDFIKKTQNLSTADRELQKALGQQCEIVNIGSLFIAYNPVLQWTTDCVRAASLESGMNIELAVLSKKFFIGTEEHALALKEAFGGTIEKDGMMCHLKTHKKPKQYWVWKGDMSDKKTLTLMMLSDALFFGKNKNISETEHIMQEAFGKLYSRVGNIFVISRLWKERSLYHLYDASCQCDETIELAVLNEKVFIGTKKHAQALKNAFGGTIKKEEALASAMGLQNSQNLWIWRGEQNESEALPFWMLLTALF